jgi:hypothetical protein
MRARDAAGAADAVSRVLPHLAPSAVLMTDSPDDAVGLLCRALSVPHALDSPADAVRALARTSVERRWLAEQVIESLPPTAPAEDDVALADALRSLPPHARATVVLHLIAGLPFTTEADAAEAALREDLARRDETERRERAQATLLFRRPGSPPDPRRLAPPCRDGCACWPPAVRSRLRRPRSSSWRSRPHTGRVADADCAWAAVSWRPAWSSRCLSSFRLPPSRRYR